MVLHHDDVEGDNWYLRYLVVGQPAGDRTTGLRVVDLDGRADLAGGSHAEERLSFDLHAVARPGAVALSSTGVILDGQVRFERFLSEQHVRRADERVSHLQLGEDRA